MRPIIFCRHGEAMRQAIAQLSPQPDLLLNDAVTIPKVTPVPDYPAR